VSRPRKRGVARAIVVKLAAGEDGTVMLDPVSDLTKGRYIRRLSHVGVSAKRDRPLVSLDKKAAAAFIEDVSLDDAGAKALALGGTIVRPMRVQDFDKMVGVTAD
jgi:hypothetical protein